MAAPDNTITTEEIVKGLNIDMTQRFGEGTTRLKELLGLFDVETLAAGTALMQLKITGKLNPAPVAEGEETPLTKYTTEEIPVGKLTIHPYRKLTTAQAVLQAGFIKAVSKTDTRMINQVRSQRFADIVTYLANGTTKVYGKSLQALLARADAALDDKLEEYGEETEGKVFFVNRLDIASYLEDKDVTTQTLYGMTYLKDFLGIEHMFVTNRVPAGKVYATVVENIHIYGVDFAELMKAGLNYEVTDDGLIGVAHEPAMNRVSCQTHVLTGMLLFAEIVDFIAVGTIGEAPADEGDDENNGGDENDGTDETKGNDENVTPQAGDIEVPSEDEMPTMANTEKQINEYAAARDIDLSGCSNKTQKLERIAAAASSN